jgi:hypothetical protein
MRKQGKEDVKLYPLAAVGITKGIMEVYVKPKLSAERAWGILGLGVLAYELACPTGQTLSEGCDKALEAHPWLTTAAIGVTALHLANLIPPQLDPFTRLTNLIKPSLEQH